MKNLINQKKGSHQGVTITELLTSFSKHINLSLQITHIAQKVSVLGVFLVRIHSKCGKIRTRKTPNKDVICYSCSVNIPTLIEIRYICRTLSNIYDSAFFKRIIYNVLPINVFVKTTLY